MSPTQRIPRRARRAERRGEIHDREPPAPLPGPRARADHPRGARPERLPLQRAPALASSRTDAATLSLLSARRPGDDAGRCGAGAPRRDDLQPSAHGVDAVLDAGQPRAPRSEEHTSELQSLTNLVCRLLLEKKKKKNSLSSYYIKKKKN